MIIKRHGKIVMEQVGACACRDCKINLPTNKKVLIALRIILVMIGILFLSAVALVGTLDYKVIMM